MHANFQLVLLAIACQIANAFSQTNPIILITAPAKLEWRGDWMYLRVSDASHRYEFPWGCPPKYSPTGIVSLETNHVYTFTVVEEQSLLVPSHLLVTNVPVPRVLRIEDQGKLIWDHEVCEVHRSKMEFKDVPIAYGLFVPRPNDPTSDEDLRLFPHRREFSNGGCAVTLKSPKTEKIHVCNDCKEAFAWWSGTATAPFSVLPRDTRYDHDQHLRVAFLDSFGKGYVAAWARKEALPIFAPTSEEEKAKVFGYLDGMMAGRIARDAWSVTSGQRYGPSTTTSSKR